MIKEVFNLDYTNSVATIKFEVQAVTTEAVLYLDSMGWTYEFKDMTLTISKEDAALQVTELINLVAKLERLLEPLELYVLLPSNTVVAAKNLEDAMEMTSETRCTPLGFACPNIKAGVVVKGSEPEATKQASKELLSKIFIYNYVKDVHTDRDVETFNTLCSNLKELGYEQYHTADAAWYVHGEFWQLGNREFHQADVFTSFDDLERRVPDWVVVELKRPAQATKSETMGNQPILVCEPNLKSDFAFVSTPCTNKPKDVLGKAFTTSDAATAIRNSNGIELMKECLQYELKVKNKTLPIEALQAEYTGLTNRLLGLSYKYSVKVSEPGAWFIHPDFVNVPEIFKIPAWAVVSLIQPTVDEEEINSDELAKLVDECLVHNQSYDDMFAATRGWIENQGRRYLELHHKLRSLGFKQYLTVDAQNWYVHPDYVEQAEYETKQEEFYGFEAPASGAPWAFIHLRR